MIGSSAVSDVGTPNRCGVSESGIENGCHWRLSEVRMLYQNEHFCYLPASKMVENDARGPVVQHCLYLRASKMVKSGCQGTCPRQPFDLKAYNIATSADRKWWKMVPLDGARCNNSGSAGITLLPPRIENGRKWFPWIVPETTIFVQRVKHCYPRVSKMMKNDAFEDCPKQQCLLKTYSIATFEYRK